MITKFFTTILAGVLPVLALAQAGYSSGSVARQRQSANVQQIPPPQEIIVEEFMNYHRHQISPHTQGVKMEMQWGNTSPKPEDDLILQIAIATPNPESLGNLPPINLSLVIDKSGSMNQDGKLEKVKNALRAFITKLRPQDVVSLVVFDSEVEVLFPAQALTYPQGLDVAIANLQSGSSTNIFGGLEAGYKELQKNYSSRYNNHLILLTDGIANVGVSNPEEILARTAQLHPSEAHLTTVGVGNDLQFDMLRQLALKGKGQSHFVGDAQDIEKTFKRELLSLFVPVAKQGILEIEFADGLSLAQCYGYTPQIDQQNIRFKLGDMNLGLTQVFVFRLFRRTSSEMKVRARLSYQEASNASEEESIAQKQTLKAELEVPALQVRRAPARFMTHLPKGEVQKNYTIAVLADALKKMAQYYHQNQVEQGKQYAWQTIQDARRFNPEAIEDADVQRVLIMLERYSATEGR